MLHATARVLVLADRRGAVLSVVGEPDSLGPFAALASTLPPAAPGMRVASLGGGILGIGDDLVDASDAGEWSPRPDWAGARQAVDWWGERLGLLSTGPDLPSLPFDPRREGEDLAVRLSTANTGRIAAGAERIAGLGPGLTPAGDDALLGVVLAWLAVGILPDEASTALLHAARPRTTPWSAAWLEAAVAGETAAPWRELIDAMAERDLDSMRTASRRVAGLGASSGRVSLQAFAGAATALLRRG